MGYLSERVNYVKGLMEGMKFDTNTDEGRLFKALIDIVEDLAISAEDLEDTQDQILISYCADVFNIHGEV